MGLTQESSKRKSLEDLFHISTHPDQHLIAFAGNPNTGKSTVFNYLTGLNQHTGNWPGKTVVNARGKFKYENKEYLLVDVPGTYSLHATSEEEFVARDFICFGNHDLVLVVADATSLERNFNLVFQVMEITDRVILVINLMDEARKKKILINKLGIEVELGIPVVLTSAKTGMGMEELKKAIDAVVCNRFPFNNKQLHYNSEIEEHVEEIEAKLTGKITNVNLRWLSLRILDGDMRFVESMRRYLSAEEFHLVEEVYHEYQHLNKEKIREEIVEASYQEAETLKNKCVLEDPNKFKRDRKIDDILTSRIFGLPIMILLLMGIFYITIFGANYPSALLSKLFFGFEKVMLGWFADMNAPTWLTGLLVKGIYRTLAWVVSVMLPPMAIFFPLFTLLEDLGYLPRIAFNMDHLFKKSCAHGKQCLTMCMGFGCNAVGVVGTRIIESPREKLVAILTNNFVPCNGRFPTLIAISTAICAYVAYGVYNSFVPTLIVTGLVILAVLATLLVSYVLSKTILRGHPSTFTLELPPYRKPKISRIIYTSIMDRTIFVLSRAVIVAIPTGALLWVLANIYVNDASLLLVLGEFLDPIAVIIGIDGIILLAFILSLPANEIFIPIVLMAYLSTGSLIEYDSVDSLRQVLVENGWTYLTAINVLLFSMFHWPCSTTLLTIKKETGSYKWTSLAFVIPTVLGLLTCFLTTMVYRLLF